MSPDTPLRLYANPAKQVIVFAGAVGFTLIGLLMLWDPGLGFSTKDAAIAYVDILFFGFCAVVLLIVLLRQVVLRHPVLQIDARGWSHTLPLNTGVHTIDWQNIAAIDVYRQRMSRNTSYWLVVHARDRRWVPRSRTGAFVLGMYPALSDGAIAVRLNDLFFRTTPAKCEQLLRRICEAYDNQLQRYGVHVYGKIQQM